VITAKDGFSLEEVMEITHWDKTLATTLLDECSRYKVPVSLALAVAYVESGYRQSARNRSCTGIYQINSNTAPSIKKMLQGDGRSISGTVHDARTNIILGIRYLAYLRGIMKSDEGMLVAYNRGVGGARSAYPSSSQYANDRYVKKVKRTQQNYK
jgi:soluble lytic murein transglycosylase